MTLLRAMGTHALVWITSGVAASAWPHEFMMAYVAHEVRVVVSPANIDITVELTFNELVSLAERRKMDRNHDGRIASDEVQSYIAGLGPKLARRLKLTVDGRAVEVFTLYEPQLDLLGADRVGPAHHVLRLSFFARTPHALTAGQDLILQDGLWNEAPALCAFQAVGAEAIQASLVSNRKILSQPGANASDRIAVIKVNSVS